MPPVPGPSAASLAQQAAQQGQSFYASVARAAQHAERIQKSFEISARQAQTATGQGFFRRLAAAQLGQQTSAAQLNAAQLQAQLAHLQSPGGQKAQQQSLAAQGREATLAAQLRAQQAHAQAALYRTPQGQAQLREQYQARRSAGKAQEEAEYLKNVAVHGRVSAEMTRFKGELAKAGATFAPFIAGLSAAAGVAYKLGAAASPAHMQTVEDSFTLLAAKVGQLVVPAFEKMAVVLQALAAEWDRLPENRKKQGQAVAIAALLPAWAIALAGDKKPEMSFDAQSRLMGHEAYGENLMEQAASGSSLQARILQEQLQALVNANILLQQVADNSAQLQRIVPQFR